MNARETLQTRRSRCPRPNPGDHSPSRRRLLLSWPPAAALFLMRTLAVPPFGPDRRPPAERRHRQAGSVFGRSRSHFAADLNQKNRHRWWRFQMVQGTIKRQCSPPAARSARELLRGYPSSPISIVNTRSPRCIVDFNAQQRRTFGPMWFPRAARGYFAQAL